MCNGQLKEKLKELFPTCHQRILDEVLPEEDGICMGGPLNYICDFVTTHMFVHVCVYFVVKFCALVSIFR